MLMKVQHVAVSENSVHNSCVSLYADLDLEIRTLSANVTESAAWIGNTRPWFLLQTYCVNRILPCCRGMM